MRARTESVQQIARALSESGAAMDWSHAMQSAEAAMDAAEGGPPDPDEAIEEAGFKLFPFIERLAFARNALEQIAEGRVPGYDAAQALCWDTLDAMDAIGGEPKSVSDDAGESWSDLMEDWRAPIPEDHQCACCGLLWTAPMGDDDCPRCNQ